METPHPYNAPWQTDFNRYPTQLGVLVGTGAVTREVDVPEGQWWRPVYFMVQYQTDAVAGDRVMELRIVPGNGGNNYIHPANVKQAASVFCTYVWGVNVSSASQTAVSQFSVSVQSIPDLLWPPTTRFLMIQNGADVGDAWHTSPGIAYEMYTEEYDNGPLVPTLVPPPLIA